MAVGRAHIIFAFRPTRTRARLVEVMNRLYFFHFHFHYTAFWGAMGRLASAGKGPPEAGILFALFGSGAESVWS